VWVWAWGWVHLNGGRCHPGRGPGRVAGWSSGCLALCAPGYDCLARRLQQEAAAELQHRLQILTAGHVSQDALKASTQVMSPPP
jgi:hypothetical protein